MQYSKIRNREIFRSVFNWVTYLFAFSIPLGNSPLNSIILIVLTLTYLFGRAWKRNKSIENKNVLLLHISFYFILVFGLLHTSNLGDGLFQLQLKLPILIIPILFLTSSFIKEEEVPKILFVFSIGVLAYTLFLLFYRLFTVDVFSLNNFMHSNISLYHPSYLSIYVVFAIFILIDNLSKKEYVKTTMIILLLSIGYLIVFCFLLASKIGVFTFFLCFVFYIFFVLKRKKVKRKVLFSGLVLFSAFTLIVLNNDKLNKRLIKSPMAALANFKKVDSKDPDSWPISFRIQIFDCAKTLLSNGHFIYGYGTGDSNDKLKKCYEQKEYGWLTARDLNSHNEYLNIMLKVGILGLSILLISLVYPFFVEKRSWARELYFVFFILLILVFLGENFLDRHKGVIFYSFFNSLFMLGLTYKNR